MEDIKKLMAEIEYQEKMLVFDHFNSQVAWELGELIHKRSKVWCFDIRVFDTKLLHYISDGFGPNADRWLEGKYNSVKQIKHASLYFFCRLKLNPDRTPESYFMPTGECGARGGGFPIIVKNVGVIGALSITGGTDHIMEHNEAVAVISEYLGITL